MKIIKFFLNFETCSEIQVRGCSFIPDPIGSKVRTESQVQMVEMVDFDRQKTADVTARALTAVATSNR